MEKVAYSNEEKQFLATFGQESILLYRVMIVFGIIASISLLILGILFIVMFIASPSDARDTYKSLPVTFTFIPASIFSAFASKKALKRIKEQGPRLKVAADGLWTEKLGFVNWEMVKDFTFENRIINTEARTLNATYLNIFLVDSSFETPDDAVMLGDADDKLIYTYTIYDIRSKAASKRVVSIIT